MTRKITSTSKIIPAKKASKIRFSHIALALALSVGTVGGMATFAALTEPAFAASSSGGGSGGSSAGGGPGGGEASPMAINNPAPPAARRHPPRHRIAAIPSRPNPCGGSADTPDTTNCKYDLRPTPRIVSIHGFANCAVIQQMPGAYGRPGEFYCARPM